MPGILTLLIFLKTKNNNDVGLILLWYSNMINSPFTAEEKADLQFLDIMELLDVNVVKNFIRLFPPQDVHDVLIVWIKIYIWLECIVSWNKIYWFKIS